MTVNSITGSGFEYDGSKIADFFDQYGEKEWNRLVQKGK